MKSNQIHANIQRALHELYIRYPNLQQIFCEINKQGGKAYFVGGMVRDSVLGKPIKDIDIEIHGLTEQQVETLLKKFGPVDSVGKTFGVFKMYGMPIDWSLPRSDEPGRKPAVTVDPHMSLEQAFRRRDLTINAMGIDTKTEELIDPFSGLADLEKGYLRSPDILFFEQDPLRFFRVMQFIARFEMQPDNELEQLCKTMDISEVSRERIEEEFHKMLLRSTRPSLGIRWLKKIGRLVEVLPELATTIGVQQDVKWHPEGDVFEHTMQAIDAAAQLDYDDEDEKLAVLYAALCHDLGKVGTTTQDELGIHSYGHAKESEQLPRTMMRRITRNKALIDRVAKLVHWHMLPVQLVDSQANLSAYKRLATKLSPEAHISMLAKLALADKRGRNPKSSEPLTGPAPEIDTFIKQAEAARVKYEKEPPLLTGKDFLDVIKPGPLLGKVVKKAYELQMEGVTDKGVLKALALQDLENH